MKDYAVKKWVLCLEKFYKNELFSLNHNSEVRKKNSIITNMISVYNLFTL